MRPVVFTVVHPETFFFSWEGKDHIWYDLHYGQKTLAGLKYVADRVVVRQSPLICVRELLLGQASTDVTLRLLHSLTTSHLEHSGLASLVANDNENPHFHEYWTYNGGVPLADEAETLEGMPSITREYPGLLFQHSHKKAFAPYSHALHLIAGGVFSRCVVNWGNVMKKTFPDIDLCYIDELCVEGNTEDKAQALGLVPQTGGRVVSFDEALTLL